MSERESPAPESEVKLTLEQGGNEDERLMNDPLSPEAITQLQRAFVGERDLYSVANQYGQRRLAQAMLDYNKSAVALEKAERDNDTDHLPFLGALQKKRTHILSNAVDEVVGSIAS